VTNKSNEKWQAKGNILVQRRTRLAIRMLTNLNHYEQAVLLDLLDYCNVGTHEKDGIAQCYPGRATVAIHTRLSVRTVSRVTKSLHIKGYIEIKHRPMERGDYTSNLYTLRLDRILADSATDADEAQGNCPADSAHLSPGPDPLPPTVPTPPPVDSTPGDPRAYKQEPKPENDPVVELVFNVTPEAVSDTYSSISKSHEPLSLASTRAVEVTDESAFAGLPDPGIVGLAAPRMCANACGNTAKLDCAVCESCLEPKQCSVAGCEIDSGPGVLRCATHEVETLLRKASNKAFEAPRKSFVQDVRREDRLNALEAGEGGNEAYLCDAFPGCVKRTAKAWDHICAFHKKPDREADARLTMDRLTMDRLLGGSE
jgi:hypothetical protein